MHAQGHESTVISSAAKASSRLHNDRGDTGSDSSARDQSAACECGRTWNATRLLSDAGTSPIRSVKMLSQNFGACDTDTPHTSTYP